MTEGVETLEQAEALRRLQHPIVQGFLFGRAMQREVLDQVLSDSDLGVDSEGPR